MWNSLELTKVLISLLSPLIAGFIAIKITSFGKKIERKQWSSQKIIESRLKFYEIVLPKLNDIYCFFNCVGNWKEIEPPMILNLKRELDKDFHIYSYIFNREVLIKYEYLINISYKTNTGWGNDAKIRASFQKRKQLDNWKKDWETFFDGINQRSLEDFNLGYQNLINEIRNDLEIN